METDNTPIPRDVLGELSEHPEVLKAVRRLASDIARDARQLAPTDTGLLKSRGIGIERVEDETTGLVHYIVGWTRHGWYGQLVEQGTEHSQPRPHLVPAAIRNGAR